MKSMPASARSRDQRARLLRRQPDARLDDRADQRPAVDAGKPARALDAEARARIALGEGVRQFEIEQPQPRELLQLEQIAGDRRQQVRQRRHRSCRAATKIDARPRRTRAAARSAPSAPCVPAGSAPRRSRAQLDAFDAGAGALLQLRRLARHRDEGAARLLAGDHAAACSSGCGVSIKYVASTRSSLMAHSSCEREACHPALSCPMHLRTGWSTTSQCRHRRCTRGRSRTMPRPRRGMPRPSATSCGCATRPIGVMAMTALERVGGEPLELTVGQRGHGQARRHRVDANAGFGELARECFRAVRW